MGRLFSCLHTYLRKKKDKTPEENDYQSCSFCNLLCIFEVRENKTSNANLNGATKFITLCTVQIKLDETPEESNDRATFFVSSCIFGVKVDKTTGD